MHLAGGGPYSNLFYLILSECRYRISVRSTNGIMMTEYNPNYEFGGGSCTLMDLREVDREKIRLVK